MRMIFVLSLFDWLYNALYKGSQINCVLDVWLGLAKFYSKAGCTLDNSNKPLQFILHIMTGSAISVSCSMQPKQPWHPVPFQEALTVNKISRNPRYLNTGTAFWHHRPGITHKSPVFLRPPGTDIIRPPTFSADFTSHSLKKALNMVTIVSTRLKIMHSLSPILKLSPQQ